MYLPTPVETLEESGPLVTLHTESTDGPMVSGSTNDKRGGYEPYPDGADLPIARAAARPRARSRCRRWRPRWRPASGSTSAGSIPAARARSCGSSASRTAAGWSSRPVSASPTAPSRATSSPASAQANRFRVVDRDSGTISNEIHRHRRPTRHLADRLPPGPREIARKFLLRPGTTPPQEPMKTVVDRGPSGSTNLKTKIRRSWTGSRNHGGEAAWHERSEWTAYDEQRRRGPRGRRAHGHRQRGGSPDHAVRRRLREER